jgi:hypothetical protein
VSLVLAQIREYQEQLVLLDRCHGLRVAAIQKEYQDFMERVRSKAQGAIDTANQDYQQKKQRFTNSMTMMVEMLQSHIPLTSIQQAAQQLQRSMHLTPTALLHNNGPPNATLTSLPPSGTQPRILQVCCQHVVAPQGHAVFALVQCYACQLACLDALCQIAYSWLLCCQLNRLGLEAANNPDAGRTLLPLSAPCIAAPGEPHITPQSDQATADQQVPPVAASSSC